MTTRTFSATALLIVLSALAACDDGTSETPETKVCVAHTAPPPTTLSAPLTAFETDVAPVLEKSCAFSSCHGSKGPSNRGIFLLANSPANVEAVKKALTAPSRALPEMAYVKPGDPENSFLMRKLDGDQCVLEERCVQGSCGKSMPEGNELLPEASRDAIRRWIAQGAK